MSLSGNKGGALLDTAGVLNILGGVLELTAGGILLAVVRNVMIGGPLPSVPHIPWMPDLEIWLVFFPTRFIIVGILILVLGVIAIMGGISAIRRKSFGLSLAGAIAAIPSIFLGVLAIIFVSVSKKDF